LGLAGLDEQVEKREIRDNTEISKAFEVIE
jgi:hypothetical protein